MFITAEDILGKDQKATIRVPRMFFWWKLPDKMKKEIMEAFSGIATRQWKVDGIGWFKYISTQSWLGAKLKFKNHGNWIDRYVVVMEQVLVDGIMFMHFPANYPVLDQRSGIPPHFFNWVDSERPLKTYPYQRRDQGYRLQIKSLLWMISPSGMEFTKHTSEDMEYTRAPREIYFANSARYQCWFSIPKDRVVPGTQIRIDLADIKRVRDGIAEAPGPSQIYARPGMYYRSSPVIAAAVEARKHDNTGFESLFSAKSAHLVITDQHVRSLRNTALDVKERTPRYNVYWTDAHGGASGIFENMPSRDAIMGVSSTVCEPGSRSDGCFLLYSSTSDRGKQDCVLHFYIHIDEEVVSRTTVRPYRKYPNNASRKDMADTQSMASVGAEFGKFVMKMGVDSQRGEEMYPGNTAPETHDLMADFSDKYELPIMIGREHILSGGESRELSCCAGRRTDSPDQNDGWLAALFRREWKFKLLDRLLLENSFAPEAHVREDSLVFSAMKEIIKSIDECTSVRWRVKYDGYVREVIESLVHMGIPQIVEGYLLHETHDMILFESQEPPPVIEISQPVP